MRPGRETLERDLGAAAAAALDLEGKEARGVSKHSGQQNHWEDRHTLQSGINWDNGVFFLL